MASNIIAAPQPLTSQNLSLAEDIWKMWQSAAPFNELVEKESNLKRSLPQAFPQMEPAAKRSVPAGGQFPPVSVAQMQSNLAQQQLLQQQAALQQALARGQIPPSFVMTPVTSALNGVPQQISIQNQLAQLEKLQKEQQQHMQQQQLQAQQQHMQQQQHQLQQQQHLQLQQMLQQRAAMQGGTLPTIPGIPAQMLQGQQVRAGMPQMIDPRQAEQYAALLKMNPQVLQAQQAQLMAQAQAQAQQQAQQVPVTAQQMIPQMSGRRQTIGPATITPQMVGAIPRMHPRPSPQLIPTSSPLTMIPSSSTTPAARSPFQIPAVCPPTAPTQVPKASPPQSIKGPEDPLFIKFLQQARGLEIQLHSVLGDGMVRLPTITAPTSTPNPTPTKD